MESGNPCNNRIRFNQEIISTATGSGKASPKSAETLACRHNPSLSSAAWQAVLPPPDGECKEYLHSVPRRGILARRQPLGPTEPGGDRSVMNLWFALRRHDSAGDSC
jgi:hypothetical protein